LTRRGYDLWGWIGLIALLAFPALLVITQLPGSPLAQIVEHGTIFGLTSTTAYEVTSTQILTSGGITYILSTTGTQTMFATSGGTTYTTTQVTQTSQVITTSSTSFVTTTSGTGSVTTTTTVIHDCEPWPSCAHEDTRGSGGGGGTEPSNQCPLCASLIRLPNGDYALDIAHGQTVTRIPQNVATLLFIITVLGGLVLYNKRSSIFG
jgi:hypothetical protein